MAESEQDVKAQKCAWYPTERCRAIQLGQLISLLITGTGIFSTYLVNNGVTLATTQSFLNYFLLAFYLIPRYMKTKAPLKNAWWKYCFLAIVDVEANFLMVTAYQYTNISSVMLLDSFTILCVVLLSYIFLKRRYNWKHFLGVGITICGMVCTFASDMLLGITDDAPNRLLGDLLCLGGAALYAVSNVGQEACLSGGNVVSNFEYLGFVGAFGSVVSGIQVAILEGQELANTEWTPATIGFLAGFVICLFSMYSATSVFLRISEALLFNLSIATSDFYGVLSGFLLFSQDIIYLYGVSAVLNVVGIWVYSLTPPIEIKTKGDQQEGLPDDTFFSTPVSTHGSVVNYISPRKVLPNGCSGRSLSVDELEQRSSNL